MCYNILNSKLEQELFGCARQKVCGIESVQYRFCDFLFMGKRVGERENGERRLERKYGTGKVEIVRDRKWERNERGIET